MRGWIFTAVVIGGLHYAINGWWMDTTAGSCENPRSGRDAAVCSCLKSEARSSIVLYQTILGGGQQKLTAIFRYCKGL